eukprot:GILI01031839.1.p1 GENE.GILI01031839.1~~GILI01031839.1.p1  ORF type:complete len:385 (-),score=18.44 GILI01031839.1:45-1175(-)
MSGGTLSGQEEIYYSLICVGLVLLAGVFSGLTLALFSIDVMYLRVQSTTGSEKDKKRATRLLSLLERQHLTLVTLLISNASAMTALPIFLERLLDPITSLIVSVTAVLFFGEVIPQATFVKYHIQIGAIFVPFVWFFIIVTFVVSYPISLLLDWIVGHKAEAMEREQLGEFLRLHGEEHPDATSKLSVAEVNVMRGAMALSTLKVSDILTVRVNDIFMLSSEAVLDASTIERILVSGFSRVPVYREGDKKHILGVLLVKSLLPMAFTCPNPPPSVGTYHLREVLRVSEDAMVEDIYSSFQGGQSHLAVVYNKGGLMVGILTLEEVFEALHSVNIEDEMDLTGANAAPIQIDLRQKQMIEVLATAKMAKNQNGAQGV